MSATQVVQFWCSNAEQYRMRACLVTGGTPRRAALAFAAQFPEEKRCRVSWVVDGVEACVTFGGKSNG